MRRFKTAQDHIWTLSVLDAGVASLTWDENTDMVYRALEGLHFLVPLGVLQPAHNSPEFPPPNHCWIRNAHGQLVDIKDALEAGGQQHTVFSERGICSAIFRAFKERDSFFSDNQVHLRDLLQELCKVAKKLSAPASSWRYFMRMIGTEISLGAESQVKLRSDVKLSLLYISDVTEAACLQTILSEDWAEVERRCLSAEALASSTTNPFRLVFCLERLRQQARTSPKFVDILRKAAGNTPYIPVDVLMQLMLNGSFSWDMQDFKCLLTIVQVCTTILSWVPDA